MRYPEVVVAWIAAGHLDYDHAPADSWLVRARRHIFPPVQAQPVLCVSHESLPKVLVNLQLTPREVVFVHGHVTEPLDVWPDKVDEHVVQVLKLGRCRVEVIKHCNPQGRPKRQVVADLLGLGLQEVNALDDRHAVATSEEAHAQGEPVGAFRGWVEHRIALGRAGRVERLPELLNPIPLWVDQCLTHLCCRKIRKPIMRDRPVLDGPPLVLCLNVPSMSMAEGDDVRGMASGRLWHAPNCST